MKFKTVFALILASSLLLTEIEPALGADTGRKQKDTVTFALWEEPAALDPQAYDRSAAAQVQTQIFDLLILEEPDGEIQPMLAEKWEWIDDHTLRFYLRKGVTFHNGEPFTAEDVKYTMMRGCTDPDSAAQFRPIDHENTKVIDDYTVDLKLKEKFAPVLFILATSQGLIVNKNTVERMGVEWHSRNPVGTGPYKFESWVSGTEINLTKYDDYWGNVAKTEKAKYKIVTESANRIIELETGAVDIVMNVLPSDMARIKDNPKLKLLQGPSYFYSIITTNMQDETLSDQRLRYALSYAIDREAIVDSLYDGTARVIKGVVPSLTKFYKDCLPEMEYNPEKAKQLLAEAGYPNGITLNMVCPTTEELQKITEAVQNMWKQVGVTINLQISDVPSYVRAGNKLQLSIRSGATGEISGALIIYDSLFVDRLNSNNKELDAMLADGKTYYDDNERAEAYAKIQDYLWEKRFSIPILEKDNMYATGANVEGFPFKARGKQRLSDVTVYADR